MNAVDLSSCGMKDAFRPDCRFDPFFPARNHLRGGAHMSIDPGAIRTVAVIGTGTIGASWAALFLGHGLDVIASDPAPDAQAHLRAFVARALPDARPEPVPAEGKLHFARTPEQAAARADL